jgi:hypothetical protein
MKRNTDTEVTRKAIVDAMRLQRPVTLTYVKADGTETVRTVEPFALDRNKDGEWYVRAMDRQSKEARTWRLDRIVFYTVHRTRFTLPAYVSTSQPPVGEPEFPAEPEAVTVLTDGPDGEDVAPGQAATRVEFRYPGRATYALTLPGTGDCETIRPAVVQELWKRGITWAKQVKVVSATPVPAASVWDGEDVFATIHEVSEFHFGQEEIRAENAWLVAAENTYYSAEEGGY